MGDLTQALTALSGLSMASITDEGVRRVIEGMVPPAPNGLEQKIAKLHEAVRKVPKAMGGTRRRLRASTSRKQRSRR